MKARPPVQAIIFDCFGVILGDALKLICDELSVDRPEDCQAVKDLIRANNRGMIEPAESNRQIAEILGMTGEEFRARKTQGEVRDEPLMDYILKELRPHFKTGMLSNIALSSLERRFAPGELDTFFDIVVASGEIGYAKPDPEAYQITAERLGVAPEACIFTDDREHFCEAARAVGMQAICYENFAQFKADLESILAT